MTNLLLRAVVIASSVCAAGAAAHALVPAPPAELPPCTLVDGVETGACDADDNPDVYIDALGRLGAGVTATVVTNPRPGICTKHDGYADTWVPSPCWSAVHAPSVVGCAWIDVTSGSFREGSCSVLYDGGTSVSTSTLISAPGCKKYGDFQTFVYGGPTNGTGAEWGIRGWDALECEVTFTGERPDGLWGPTWLKVRGGIDIAEDGRGVRRGYGTSAVGYVPIDGDLRDLGPVASFTVAANEAGRVVFANASVHTRDQPMTYRWSFGDGATSGAKDPTHSYDAPGSYTVELTATDPDGDESTYRRRVEVRYELLVAVTTPPDSQVVGEPFEVTVEVRNPFETAVTDFAPTSALGLELDPEQAMVVSGPSPAPPSELGAGENVAFTYTVEALHSGDLHLTAGFEGFYGALHVDGEGRGTVFVPARLSVTLATSIDAETRVGDDFDVVATLTNEEADVEITGIRLEALEVIPSEMTTPVSGPTSAAGGDPRVDPFSLGPGASTTVTWRLKAEQQGTADVVANASAHDPYTGDVFVESAEKRIAIEDAAIEVSNLRLRPGAPAPGDTGNISATVTNIGSVDVADLDFRVLTDIPEIHVIEKTISELPADVAPRFALLEPGESRDVLIPFIMAVDIGDSLATYRVEVEYTGSATLDGQAVQVDDKGRTNGGLDLTDYWTNLLSAMGRLIRGQGWDIVEGVNEWGDESTLGGVTVGCGEGALSAFQKMGDGILTVNDLLGEVSGDNGQRLTEDGKAIVAAAREYLHTTSKKKMLIDFANVRDDVSVGAVDVFASWLYDIDQAYEKGDTRRVAGLIAEPTTEFATGVGVEAAGAQLFQKIVGSKVAREVMHHLKKGPSPVDEATGQVPYDKLVRRELEDLKDMPTGVRITGETVERAGITPDEHAWMIEMSKEHGVAFFVRPRPESATKFAHAGFNAKPMLIKQKSINDIDIEWLGYPDSVDLPEFDGPVDPRGLVVMREPVDPWPRLVEHLESGELKWGSEEVTAIAERYSKRRAEWLKFQSELDKLNAGDGFTVRRFGEEIKTKIFLDEQGVLRMTHNGKPVYSDVDLMHIAWPNGKHLPQELHDEISKAAGFGIDSQHGDTASTSDFHNKEIAAKLAREYLTEHMRGGDPLVIVQPDVTTLGYVEDFDIPLDFQGSYRELYGKLEVSYEGAAQSCPVP